MGSIHKRSLYIDKIIDNYQYIWYVYYVTGKNELMWCESGEDMWYSALEVARYIITECSLLQKPISNLKLQKMLYFLWVDFYKRTNRSLFLDDICAWQLGPVVPDVYYEFCSYAGMAINVVYGVGIEQDDQVILDDIIEEYVDVPVNVLVERTHRKGTAWDAIYQDGAGKRKVIPFQLIIEKEIA